MVIEYDREASSCRQWQEAGCDAEMCWGGMEAYRAWLLAWLLVLRCRVRSSCGPAVWWLVLRLMAFPM